MSDYAMQFVWDYAIRDINHCRIRGLRSTVVISDCSFLLSVQKIDM